MRRSGAGRPRSAEWGRRREAPGHGIPCDVQVVMPGHLTDRLFEAQKAVWGDVAAGQDLGKSVVGYAVGGKSCSDQYRRFVHPVQRGGCVEQLHFSLHAHDPGVLTGCLEFFKVQRGDLRGPECYLRNPVPRTVSSPFFLRVLIGRSQPVGRRQFEVAGLCG